MSGANRVTGKELDGWEHCVQSLMQIITTPKGTRVMRRDFGSEVPYLVDRPGTQDRVVDVTMALAEAIEHPEYGEPRFRLRRCSIIDAGIDGRFEVEIDGIYYPRGHLGDFSVFEDERKVRIRV